MGLVGVKWFFSPSVPTVAAWRVDRLKLLEIEVGDRLEFVGQSRSFEVVRQVVEPGPVLVLQSDQRRHRCCPTPWAWRETRRRRDGRWAGLLAQLGTASRLPLGRGQWCLVDAMSGNTDLRLSNVTVTFPAWLGQSVGFVVRQAACWRLDRPRGVRHKGANIAPQTCIR
jgi:hypothetical protein